MQQFLGTILGKMMKAWSWVTLILLVILIKLSSLYSGFIEQYYSNGVYPVISKVLRFLFGWLPFSIGDLIYGFFIVVILVKTWQLLRVLFKRKFNRRYLVQGLKQIIFFFLFVYVFFYLLWGLNYSRKGIATQLNLKMSRYSLAELDTLTNVLEQRLNYYAGLVEPAQRDSFYKKRNLFHESYEAYKLGVERYHFLSYRPKSIKPSIFSYAGNILGFEGYYNPFSGEGQVNTTIPVFLQPFVACHEVGHQVGYGKENEANFAGFLACRLHPSPVFRYSVYFDMYNYTIHVLFRSDSTRAKQYLKALHPQVKKDYDELDRFFKKYQNPIEPVITWVYGKYLQANNQPAGKKTYSEVIAFLIAYQRKFGKESL
ncbi:MAG TPA: DUF3810 domain-containing protein [Chitinophagaceae bacterium]|jgi:hypothetical protein|nr:DUF3810 domain-containing protein [Chitinophagaceae bacterium]